MASDGLPGDPDRAAGQRARPLLRSVAVPTEHGGWGLTLEPVLLGLLLRPSGAGALLGIVALLAFVARTPLKLVLVDRRRHRRLARTRLAERVAAGEIALLVALVVGAAAVADTSFLLPLAVAAPFVLVSFWFDMRSRSRRLLPEVTGAVAMAAMAAVIVVAGGGDETVAFAAWLILAARVLTSVPFTRAQVALLHGRHDDSFRLEGDTAALGGAAVAWAADDRFLLGAIATAGVVAVQRVTETRPPARAAILGVRQLLLGLLVVGATATGVRWL